MNMPDPPDPNKVNTEPRRVWRPGEGGVDVSFGDGPGPSISSDWYTRLRNELARQQKQLDQTNR
jgi:hypothetical protein